MKQVTLTGVDGSKFTITGDPDDPGIELPDSCRCHGFRLGSDAWKTMHDWGHINRD